MGKKRGQMEPGTEKRRKVIAVDFDGTLAKTRFPVILEPIPEMIRYCRREQRRGAVLILWTCRKGKELRAAVEWCMKQGLVFDYINENTAEHLAEYGGKDTRKVYADEYIDDKAYNPKREKEYWQSMRHVMRNGCWQAAVCGFAAGTAAVLLGAVIMRYITL